MPGHIRAASQNIMTPPGMICMLSGRKQREKAVCFSPRPFLLLRPPTPTHHLRFCQMYFWLAHLGLHLVLKPPRAPCCLKMHSKLQKAFTTLPPPAASSGSLPGRVPRIFGRRCVLCLHLPPSHCLEGADVVQYATQVSRLLGTMPQLFEGP